MCATLRLTELSDNFIGELLKRSNTWHWQMKTTFPGRVIFFRRNRIRGSSVVQFRDNKYQGEPDQLSLSLFSSPSPSIGRKKVI